MKLFDYTTLKARGDGFTYLKESKRRTPSVWSDLAICLSLVNIAFLRVWTELLTYTRADTFRMAAPPSPVEYYAVMLNVLVGGGILFGLVTLVRRHPTNLRCISSYIGFLLGFVLCLNGVRSVLSNHYTFLRGQLLNYISAYAVIAVVALLAMIISLAMILWTRQLVRMAVTLVLILTPFVLINFVEAGMKLATYDARAFANKPTAAPLPVTPGAPRFLWIIFDQFDDRLGFYNRPAGIQLPELDRFRQESVYATKAYSPDTFTRFSLPSLINGRFVLAEDPDMGVDSVRFRYAGSPALTPWTSTDSVFAAARQLGFNTALAGWYLPYCRILSDSLTRCWWSEMEKQINSNGSGLAEVLPNQARTLLETSLLSPFGQSLPTRRKVRQFAEMRRESISMATDPSIALTLLHLPVPHPPFIYDRGTKAMTLANTVIDGYVDNLELADQVLGDLRRGMENAGLWDNTTVLISSDHPYLYAWRIDGKRSLHIPFMVRLAGQQKAVPYEKEMNSVLTKNLILACLKREITTTESLVSWLDSHREAKKPVI